MRIFKAVVEVILCERLWNCPLQDFVSLSSCNTSTGYSIKLQQLYPDVRNKLSVELTQAQVDNVQLLESVVG